VVVAAIIAQGRDEGDLGETCYTYVSVLLSLSVGLNIKEFRWTILVLMKVCTLKI
jgi:hypothetical protein